MEEKGKLLTDISLLLQETRSWANGVMESLDWTKDHLLQKDEVLQQCTFDANHRMPRESLEKHHNYCPRVKRGFTKQEVDEMLSPNCFYAKSKSIIPVHIDDLLERNILRAPVPEQLLAKDIAPSNVVTAPSLTQFDTELTPSGRLAIHKYCVAKGRQEGLEKIGDEELMMLEEKSRDRNSNKPKSFLEKKAELRDQKRHRAKYKTTHTGKKSHKEIIGEVIRNQMEALADLWREEQGIEKKETEDDKPKDTAYRYPEDARDRDVGHRSYRDRSRSPYRNQQSRSREFHRRKGRQRSRSRSWDRRRSRSRSRERRPARRRSRSREKTERDGSTEARSRRESPESGDSKRHKKHKKDKHKHKHKRSHEKESKEEPPPKKQPLEPITDDVLWETSVLS